MRWREFVFGSRCCFHPDHAKIRTHATKERCVFGQDSPLCLLIGLVAIGGAIAGFALLHGTVAPVACLAVLLFGLFMVLLPGHGVIHLALLWKSMTGKDAVKFDLGRGRPGRRLRQHLPQGVWLKNDAGNLGWGFLA